MTNKSTKKALLLSVLSMLICVAMLVGTTLAWFTDSVTSGRNTIKAGNLDVVLEYWNGEKYVEVGESTKLFDDAALWEPGHTEVAYLKVSNAGTLALKYMLSVNVYSEVAGTNVYGDAFNLSDHLVFSVVEDKAIASDADLYTRETAVEAAGTALGLESYIGGEKELTVEDATDYVALIIYMPTTVGNEANYATGTDAPSIEMGVELVATQSVEEADFFDDQYDKNAVYYEALAATQTDIANAISAGKKTIAIDGTVTLTSAMNASGVTFVGFGDNAVLDFGTYGIFGSDITYKNLTLDNDRAGWYEGMEYGNATNNTYIDCVIANGVTTYGNSTFIGCTFNELAGEYALFIYGGKNITVEDCVFNYGNRAIKIYNEGYTPNVTLTLSNTAFKASETTVANKAMIEIDDTYMQSVNVTVTDITVDSAIAAQGVYRIDDGALDTSTDKSKVSVNGVVTSAVANDQTGLDEAVANGATYVELGDGNYIIPDSAQGKTLTFVGNGDTVVATQDDGSYEGCDYSLQGSTVTFENITISTDSSTYTGYARLNATYNNCTINGTYTLYGDSVFNDCTFNVSGDVYNIWTWGAPNATFNGCTFNSDGKALLLYGTVNTNLTVNNCVFNDNGGLTDLKAAIEIGNDYNKSYTLTVNNTVVNGYEINDKGINTGSTLWANKNSMGTDKLNVVIDGADVY